MLDSFSSASIHIVPRSDTAPLPPSCVYLIHITPRIGVSHCRQTSLILFSRACAVLRSSKLCAFPRHLRGPVRRALHSCSDSFQSSPGNERAEKRKKRRKSKPTRQCLYPE